VRVLLDENFPLQLHRRLIDAGHSAEHIIVLGRRGAPDAEIRRRLATEDDLVLLTQDTDFEQLAADARGATIISRVPQGLPLEVRTNLWFTAIERFLADPPPGRLFELLASGEIVGWEVR